MNLRFFKNRYNKGTKGEVCYMKKESAKNILNNFKWFNIIGAVILFVVAAIIFTSNDSELVAQISSSMNIGDTGEINPTTVLGLAFVFYVIFTLIEAILYGRVIKDGSKSTLLMVLLCLTVCSNIYTLITAFKPSAILKLCITLLTLYAVYVLRKEAK